MHEGSPVVNIDSSSVMTPNPASMATVDTKPNDLVIAYATRDQLPVQLEHWLRKRQMGMMLSESANVDVNEIRASGARFVMIDLDTHGGQDLSVLRTIRAELPGVRIVVATANNDQRFVESLADAGAAGVVVKRPYVADLALALQAAGEGRSFISGQPGQRDAASVQITARERQVLELMANGYSNQAIGEKLSISVKTVEAHRARLFKKLGASNVADAVLLAIRVGLVTP